MQFDWLFLATSSEADTLAQGKTLGLRSHSLAWSITFSQSVSFWGPGYSFSFAEWSSKPIFCSPEIWTFGPSWMGSSATPKTTKKLRPGSSKMFSKQLNHNHHTTLVVKRCLSFVNGYCRFLCVLMEGYFIMCSLLWECKIYYMLCYM
jgi:hypothetical protein